MTFNVQPAITCPCILCHNYLGKDQNPRLIFILNNFVIIFSWRIIQYLFREIFKELKGMDKCQNKNTSKESLKTKPEINNYSTLGYLGHSCLFITMGSTLHTDEKRNMLDTDLGREMCDQMRILGIHFLSQFLCCYSMAIKQAVWIKKKE